MVSDIGAAFVQVAPAQRLDVERTEPHEVVVKVGRDVERPPVRRPLWPTEARRALVRCEQPRFSGGDIDEPHILVERPVRFDGQQAIPVG